MVLAPSSLPATHDAADDTAEAAACLERVQGLLPRIREAADDIERDRRIPAAVVDALHDAGLFRLFLPRSLGGAEAHPLTFMQVLEAIAGADASTAWVLGQTAVCAVAGAYLAPEAARDVFGKPRAVLAWGPPGPGTKAVACEGGYRVTGHWSFASGGRHATWLGGYCPVHEADGTPRLKDDGKPVMRVMLFPAEQAAMEDVWHVIGLRGTASDSFSVQDLFVPQAYSVLRDSTDEVREPGWLYAFKTTNLYATGFASVALGVARSMLDAFLELALTKTPRGYPSPLRDNSATQAELGRAEAQHRAARAYLHQTMGGICAEVQRSGAVTMEQRMAMRLAATHTIQQAMQVGDFAYAAAGSSAILNAGPFERRFRDLHAIAQQVQGRRSHYQTVGKYLMGGEAETTFL